MLAADGGERGRKRKPDEEEDEEGPNHRAAMDTSGLAPPSKSTRNSEASEEAWALDHEVRPLIDLIDNLRSLGVRKDVSIPQARNQGESRDGVREGASGRLFIVPVSICHFSLNMPRFLDEENLSRPTWSPLLFIFSLPALSPLRLCFILRSWSWETR